MVACVAIIIFLIMTWLLIYKTHQCKDTMELKRQEKERADFWAETYKEECRRKEAFKTDIESIYSKQIQGLKTENDLLKSEKRILELMLKNNKNIPSGTIDAVKYAVKKSHPDNGGNAGDFIKFKKCLDELEGMMNGR